MQTVVRTLFVAVFIHQLTHADITRLVEDYPVIQRNTRTGLNEHWIFKVEFDASRPTTVLL